MKVANLLPIGWNIPKGRSGPTVAAYNLQRALVNAGIDSVAFGCKNFKLPGKLRYLYDQELNSDPYFQEANRMERAKMILMHNAFTYSQASEFDIVHSHLLDWALPFAAERKDVVSVLLISNVPNKFVQEMMERFNAPHLHFIALTKSQSQFFPRSVKNFTVVSEPIDTDRLHPKKKVIKEDSALFVGRLIKYKRPHLAIRACIESNMKIVVIGSPPPKFDTKDYEYYEREVEPLLKHKLVTHIKQVAHQDMWKYYQKAKVFIFPTDHKEEAMGMVTIEAQAAGTPVVALKNPLSEELIIHGKTGYLARTPRELALGISQVQKYDPMACQKFADQKSSYQSVGMQFKKLYAKLLREQKR